MKYAAFFLILALLLTSCVHAPKSGTTPTQSIPDSTAPSQSDATQPSAIPSPEGLFSDRDFDTTVSVGTEILLEGSSIRCSGSGVTISGSTATITGEGTYILTGKLENGSIRIQSDKQSKVQLVLRNATIHSEVSAPIYVMQADKVFLTLEGSNHLSSGSTFEATEDGVDAVIFSQDDLTINGSGSLTIQSPGGHGICAKDELTITGGTFTVTAAKHGLEANDSLCIADGNFSICSGKDALRADSSDEGMGFVYIQSGIYQIESTGDGISASASLQIDGGTFDLLTGGGSTNGEEHTDDMFGGMGGPGGMGGMPGGRPGGMGGGMGSNNSGSNSTTTSTDSGTSCKGLKAGDDLLVQGGTLTLNCADDAIHGNADVTIAGGSLTITTGDDAFHADATLTISAGLVLVSESYEGLEAEVIRIHGGDITLKATDDGLNAAGGNDQSGFGGRPGDRFASSSDSAIEITGGTLFVDANGDGIDSNGNLTITGGYTVVEGPTNGGNGPLDYGGIATVSGGTLIVTGSVQMAQAIQPSGQGALNLSVGSQSAGTAVTIADSSGKTVLTFTPGKAFACVIVSSPSLVSGESYHITIGSVSGDVAAD